MASASDGWPLWRVSDESNRAISLYEYYLRKAGELQELCFGEGTATEASPKICTGEKVMEPNGQWFTDQSQLKLLEGVPSTKTMWSITVDEYTNLGISAFYNAVCTIVMMCSKNRSCLNIAKWVHVDQ